MDSNLYLLYQIAPTIVNIQIALDNLFSLVYHVDAWFRAWETLAVSAKANWERK